MAPFLRYAAKVRACVGCAITEIGNPITYFMIGRLQVKNLPPCTACNNDTLSAAATGLATAHGLNRS